MALNPHNSIVIRIPDTKVLRVLSRSLFLFMILVTLPFLGNILNGFSFTLSSHSCVVSKTETSFGSYNFEVLNLILHDMGEKGIYKKDDKALIVSPSNGFEFEGIDVVIMDSDYERKSLFLDESYDFVFTWNSSDVEFVDRIVKLGGIVVMLNSLKDKPSSCGFREQLHYRVVYLRSYGSSMIVALRKTSSAIKQQYGNGT
ncbi:uncharacterized protein LOC131598460 [Vicia villosa]|uniref:uncharacterized protein LOC131598460 n=1 Tax=Vicia villosa TaxID=3911 RepID=UPI00273C564A|nr:uncharacterized protein LOC131598460 [Vicia villosa]